MLDEEKEILNNLKEYMQDSINKGYHKFIYNDLGWDFKCIDCINVINKFLKQSKEIEELKEENRVQRKQLNDAFNRGWIHEDKIKAKIEEVKNTHNGDDFNLTNVIMILQSLLGKE